MDTKRRNFNKMILASLGGIVAGAQLGPSIIGNVYAGDEKHVCKGMNSCKGKGGCETSDAGCAGKNSCKGHGGCATTERHECAGKNDCKGQGGCRSGDNGCAGKNSCKGKGGCAVPIKEGHLG